MDNLISESLELTYETNETQGWVELIWEAQQAIEAEIHEPLASFDLPVWELENPCEVYRKSQTYARIWMDRMLKEEPLELGKMVIRRQVEETAAKVQWKAEQRFIELFEQLQRSDPRITEELNTRDPMQWVSLVSECQMKARRMVMDELANS